MAYLKYKRRVRRPALKAAVKSNVKARQYNSKASVASVASVAKQVKRLKAQMRKETEIKQYQWSQEQVFGGVLGQVNANLTGACPVDLNLALGQGTGDFNRIGEHVNLKGILLNYQLRQQASATSPCKIKCELFKTQDMSSTLGQLVAQTYEVNTMSGIEDYFSSRNIDYKGKIFHVKTFNHNVKGDSYSGQLQVPINMKRLVKQRCQLDYTGSTFANPVNWRYFCIFTASAGNASTSTASTLPFAGLTAINTGWNVFLTRTMYYTDN